MTSGVGTLTAAIRLKCPHVHVGQNGRQLSPCGVGLVGLVQSATSPLNAVATKCENPEISNIRTEKIKMISAPENDARPRRIVSGPNARALLQFLDIMVGRSGVRPSFSFECQGCQAANKDPAKYHSADWGIESAIRVGAISFERTGQQSVMMRQ
ncbi:MAG: hypothetical protein Q7S58_14815 [Candidatus Binatus sp.]|uniref:hypothetical protein n=1 Tax=Candidatus Binatus sp. TaxID=2811406 RepID=UPI00272128BB|nr:hypothetical protein [Candidatus Binatus sp.]MDO8433674.1 hypothetical protein [Candidatus Binatus sp.]